MTQDKISAEYEAAWKEYDAAESALARARHRHWGWLDYLRTYKTAKECFEREFRED